MLAILAQRDVPGRGDQLNRHGRQGEGLEHRPIPGLDQGFQVLGHAGHFVGFSGGDGRRGREYGTTKSPRRGDVPTRVRRRFALTNIK